MNEASFLAYLTLFSMEYHLPDLDEADDEDLGYKAAYYPHHQADSKAHIFDRHGIHPSSPRDAASFLMTSAASPLTRARRALKQRFLTFLTRSFTRMEYGVPSYP